MDGPYSLLLPELIGRAVVFNAQGNSGNANPSWSSENIHFLQTFCRLCNARLAFLRKTPEEKFEALKEKLVETPKEKFKAPTVRTTDH